MTILHDLPTGVGPEQLPAQISVKADPDEVPHGLLRGPSTGFRAWTEYWLAVLERVVEIRKRWREGDQPSSTRSSWPIVRGGTLVALVTVVATRVSGVF